MANNLLEQYKYGLNYGDLSFSRYNSKSHKDKVKNENVIDIFKLLIQAIAYYLTITFL